MQLIAKTKRSKNTFHFFIKENDDGRKFIVISHHTDFSGTCLEEDFPDGDTTNTEHETWAGYTNQQACNIIGRKLIKNWTDLKS